MRLAEALEAWSRAREARRGAASALAEVRAVPKGAQPTVLTGARWARERAFDAERRRAIAEAERRLAQALRAEAGARRDVEDAREELADAAVAQKIVERHREAWDREQQQKREHAEQDRIDDASAATFFRRFRGP
ncbi:MAG: hypothetical protein AB7S26_08250 [Sandaracinaceae bacterium]